MVVIISLPGSTVVTSVAAASEVAPEEAASLEAPSEEEAASLEEAVPPQAARLSTMAAPSSRAVSFFMCDSLLFSKVMCFSIRPDPHPVWYVNQYSCINM